MGNPVELSPVRHPRAQIELEIDGDAFRVTRRDERSEAFETVVVLGHGASHRFLHLNRVGDDVVGSAFFDSPVVGLSPIALGGAPPPSENRTFDPLAAPVGENENTGGAPELGLVGLPVRDCLLVKPDRQIASAAQPLVVFRPVANVVLLLLRVLVLAALGILHARTYLGHHHRRISRSARAVQQRRNTSEIEVA